jgi:hypothetical protein
VDDTTEPQSTPPVEPQATSGTPQVELPDLATVTDEQIVELIESETVAATALAEGDPAAFDEATFNAHMAKAEHGRTELAARQAKAAAFNAARARVAELARTNPKPAAASVPSVADLPKTGTPTPQVPAQRSRYDFALIVPSDAHNAVEGRSQGSRYQSFDEVGQVLHKRATAAGVGGKGMSRQLLEIHRNDHQFTVTNDNPIADDAVIREARNQRRLNGGSLMQSWKNSLLAAAGGDEKRISLTAAAGWCAPSENYYDLCEMESLDGLIDLPTVTASRGGIRWTQEPTYPQMDAATMYTHLTEAQVIAATAKNCAPIPCPTFTDTRLDVSATCVTGSFLQNAGYPELTARWVRGAMVVHAHKRNEDIISALVTRAGAVTAVAAPAGDPITSALLSAVELAANDIRYRNRLAFSAPIEIVLPAWVIPLIRADFTRRSFGDPGLTDARIMEWFLARSVRPIFVYDWQDGYSGAGATFPGGDGTPPFALTVVPAGTAVQFLAFPAGGVVLAQQDVVNLRSVYDAANIQQNLYTELFFEEGWAPIYPCAEIRLYSAQTCPSGATGLPIDLDCAP